MRRLRVAGCQFNPIIGDLDGNVAKIVRYLERAEEAGADLAVFPELAVCGYPPLDLVFKHRFIDDMADAVQHIASRTGDTAVAIGYVSGQRDLFNSSAICHQGEVVSTYQKRLLPNYAVFDEKRYFSAGVAPMTLVELRGLKVGMVICEDAWSATGPLHEQARGGAEVICVLNASPYRRGKPLDRDLMLAARSIDNSVALVYVNQVGGQDELVFDGGSVVFSPEGGLLARSPMFQEDMLVADLDLDPLYRKRRLDPRGQVDVAPQLPVAAIDGPRAIDGPAVATSVSPIPEPLAEVWSALVLGTRDYVEKNGFTDVGVAVSGGVDSAIVAAIAADAVGAERVHGVLLPSRYSSDHSITDAAALCENLGIDHRQIDIETAHSAFEAMLAPSFGELPADTTEENLQSRIRGVVMMALSNKLGWMILTTGNKSETAVGYSTLYGDTAGGYAVIKDVEKLLVYDLCRWRNETEGRELIPEAILTKPPSAELRPDQRDDQSLPPYEELDPMLAQLVEGDRTPADLIAMGADEQTVRRIARLVDSAEYKRRQSPPGIRITTKQFGSDRRMPITQHYRG